MNIIRLVADRVAQITSESANANLNETNCPRENFRKFVDENYQSAYRFAYHLCGNHNDASDITQQAFYLAQSHDHQLRDQSKRKPWFFSILHREFLKTYRGRRAHPEVELESSESLLPHVDVDYASSIDSKTLLLFLKTLDDSYKFPLVLFYLNELSYKEIASVLKVPIGTVMSRLARGKQILRQRLEKASGIGNKTNTHAALPREMRVDG